MWQEVHESRCPNPAISMKQYLYMLIIAHAVWRIHMSLYCQKTPQWGLFHSLEIAAKRKLT